MSWPLLSADSGLCKLSPAVATFANCYQPMSCQLFSVFYSACFSRFQLLSDAA